MAELMSRGKDNVLVSLCGDHALDDILEYMPGKKNDGGGDE
jgi:hypothetical protein